MGFRNGVRVGLDQRAVVRCIISCRRHRLIRYGIVTSFEESDTGPKRSMLVLLTCAAGAWIEVWLPAWMLEGAWMLETDGCDDRGVVCEGLTVNCR